MGRKAWVEFAGTILWIALLVLSTNAIANTFTVTNTNDSGAGSLAQAITDANNLPGADVIAFKIPGAGVHTITVTGDGLPGIVDDVTHFVGAHLRVDRYGHCAGA